MKLPADSPSRQHRRAHKVQGIRNEAFQRRLWEVSTVAFLAKVNASIDINMYMIPSETCAELDSTASRESSSEIGYGCRSLGTYPNTLAVLRFRIAKPKQPSTPTFDS